MQKPVRLLIVEDDEDYRLVLRKEIQRLQDRVPVEGRFFDSVADAQRAITGARVDVVMSDFELPDGTGADVMDHAATASPTAHRIVLTGTPERARKATRHRGQPHAVWDKAIGLSELRNRLLQLVTVLAMTAV